VRRLIGVEARSILRYDDAETATFPTCTSGKARNGCAESRFATTTSRLLGGLRLPQLRRPVERAALLERLSVARAPILWRLRDGPDRRDPTREDDSARSARLAGTRGWPALRRPAHRRGRLSGAALLFDRLGAGRCQAGLDGGAARRRGGLAVPDRGASSRGPTGASRSGRWPFHLAHVRWGPLVLIAGGSGLVPLMAMLRDRAANSSTGDARLLVSSRSLGDVLYREELATLAEGGGLVVHHTFTRDPPAAWCGASLGGSTQRCCVRAGPRRRGRRGSSSARHSSSERPTRSSSSATNRPRSEPTDSPRQDDEMNDAAALDRNKRCATARSAVPITHSR
jgi:hypothetical protein